MNLRPFQRRFLRAALAPGCRTAALSLPRGNGKSTLAAHLLRRALTPGDPLHHPGTESLAVAGSFDQARLVFRMVRAALDMPGGEYRFSDSGNRIHAVHVPSGTSFRLMGSNAKRAMGLVNVPLVIADEPGAWEVTAGELMYDAIITAQGKPDSSLRAIFIGTIAPARSGWWPQLIERGSRGSVHVTALQGDPKTWDRWPTIRKANPLVDVSADFRAKLLEERDEARADTRLKARFLSYRLNVPTADEASVLLTTDDWQRVTDRAVPDRGAGKPIVGVDLGGGRAWSAAVALWRSGRVEALAVAPGIPTLAAQEKRDRVPAGLYQRLAEGGALTVAEGLRVQPPAALWRAVRARWGRPEAVLCDRFRLAELADCVQGAVPLVPRVTRWSEAAADIRALRKMAKDGPLSCAPDSRDLVAASLAVATVKTDDQGSTRLVKRGTNNEARDDVAAALLLAAGALDRAPKPRRLRSALA